MAMKKLIPALAALLVLTGCSETRTTTIKDNINTEGFFARFDPSNSVLPFPNNLLFSGTSHDIDGTLKIPVDPAAADAAVKTALNSLDGFSTITPITANFSTSVDADSLIGGDSVRLFEVTLTSGAVTGIISELTSGSDYAVSLSSLDANQTSLVISPLKPLKTKASYLVILTNGINDSNGIAATAELPYSIAKSGSALVDGSGVSQVGALNDAEAAAFEPVRQLVNAAEIAVTTFDTSLSRGDIVLSWSFTTQSVGDVLSAVRTKVQTDPAPASVLAATGTESPQGNADIYAGTIELPYYLSAPSQSDPTAPLTNHWHGAGESELTQFNTTPVATSTQTVPLLAAIPKTGSAPWPVVIYQHGITSNRATLLAIADSLAAAGFASVAIDLPLHGLTGNETDGTQAFYMDGGERTFELDLLDNTTGAAGTDGTIDASGSHFINLTNLLTSRDNLRQAVADLFSLTRALETMDYDGGGADFDTSNIHFVGHSLGAMVGSIFLALEPNVGAATLAMPGGGIAKLLDGSATFGPQIAAGLAANGLNKGTAEFEAFMASAQMVMDSGDPINYAEQTGNGRGIHLIEIVGGGGALPDQVIPNNVLNVAGTVPSPTAGTDPLATLMGLNKLNTDTTGTNLQAWVRFTAGHHVSLLTPNDAAGNADATSAAVNAEIQKQMVTFLTSDGATLDITDNSLIE